MRMLAGVAKVVLAISGCVRECPVAVSLIYQDPRSGLEGAIVFSQFLPPLNMSVSSLDQYLVPGTSNTYYIPNFVNEEDLRTPVKYELYDACTKTLVGPPGCSPLGLSTLRRPRSIRTHDITGLCFLTFYQRLLPLGPEHDVCAVCRLLPLDVKHALVGEGANDEVTMRKSRGVGLDDRDHGEVKAHGSGR